MAIDSNEPLSKTGDLLLESADPAVSAVEANHADPLTGEPDAHPAAVGLGAAAAGALGAAAIGAFAGPIGAVIGAAIGAVAGGLTGHEVASASEEPITASTRSGLDPEATGSDTDASGRPSSLGTLPEEDIMVFPGIDLGSPAVMTQGTAAAAFASNLFPSASAPAAAGTMEAEAPAAADEPEDFAVGGESAGAFSVGADPLDSIRVAAYYHYLGRLESGQPGDALDDWCAAEREVYRF